jgi:hypothetical protein
MVLFLHMGFLNLLLLIGQPFLASSLLQMVLHVSMVFPLLQVSNSVTHLLWAFGCFSA